MFMKKILKIFLFRAFNSALFETFLSTRPIRKMIQEIGKIIIVMISEYVGTQHIIKQIITISTNISKIGAAIIFKICNLINNFNILLFFLSKICGTMPNNFNIELCPSNNFTKSKRACLLLFGI